MFWVVALVRVRRALRAAILGIMFMMMMMMLVDMMGVVLISFLEMRVYPLQSEKREDLL